MARTKPIRITSERSSQLYRDIDDVIMEFRINIFKNKTLHQSEKEFIDANMFRISQAICKNVAKTLSIKNQ